MALLGNVVTSSTLCDGLRLDRTMSYHQFLQEFALDLSIQDELNRKKEFDLLAQYKYRAYVKQSTNVKKAQAHLCGKVSSNWN
jgi:hypothetical protein